MTHLPRRQALAYMGAAAALCAAPGVQAAVGVKLPLRWLLRDVSLSDQDLAAAGLSAGSAAPGRPVLKLEPDLVRQWRDGLATVLCQADAPWQAWVRWDKALVLQGLLRERGIATRLSRRSGGVFEVRSASAG